MGRENSCYGISTRFERYFLRWFHGQLCANFRLWTHSSWNIWRKYDTIAKTMCGCNLARKMNGILSAHSTAFHINEKLPKTTVISMKRIFTFSFGLYSFNLSKNLKKTQFSFRIKVCGIQQLNSWIFNVNEWINKA